MLIIYVQLKMYQFIIKKEIYWIGVIIELLIVVKEYMKMMFVQLKIYEVICKHTI